MSEIILSYEGTKDVCVPSGFLTDYMPKANGEFVKIYLYILSCLQCSKALSVSELADQFEIAEKDIDRAIKYWEGKGILSCEREENTITSIKLLTPWNKTAEKASANEQFSESLCASESSETYKAAALPACEESPVYDVTLSPSQIKQIESKKEFSMLCKLVESLFKMKSLNTIDYEKLMWIFYNLNYNFDACEVLIEHCVAHPTKGKRMRQLETLTITFLDRNITDPKLIKLTLLHEHHCKLVMAALGVSSKALASTEQDYVRKWFELFRMSEELVKEACRRAVINVSEGRFVYTDRILTSWHNNKITTTDEVKKLDEIYKKSHLRAGQGNAKQDSGKTDRFVNFTQRNIDFDEQEALIFGLKKDTDKPAEDSAGAGSGKE